MAAPAAHSYGRGTSTGPPQSGGRRDQILAMVRQATRPLTVADIADRVGVHPNTVRFHLEALVEAGRVDRALGDSAGPGRPPMVFVPRRKMDRHGPRNYQLLAKILASNLAATASEPAKAATAIGRGWGGYLIERPPPPGTSTAKQAVAGLLGLLKDLHFEPEFIHAPAGGGRAGQIGLRHCPFLELVDTHAEVICPLHLGLMQGAMSALAAPLTVDRLEAFVEPDLCVAHLAQAGRSRVTTNVARAARRGRR